MPEAPAEPASLTNEILRAMRDEMNSRFDRLEADVKDIKSLIRGCQRNSIAEIHEPHLTVASFVDLEERT